jgi:hypothetical protein
MNHRASWIVSATFALTTIACGGSTTVFADDDGGAGGQAAGGNAPVSCDLPVPGKTFTFTIRNTGTRELGLSYACGATMPILLDTPDGERGIGAGNAGFCEVSCDDVYDGYENWGCSDCGPGYGDALPPGGEVTITWDRRYYVEHEAPAACSGNAEGNACSLGKLALASEVTRGHLDVCTSDGVDGYCWGGDVETFDFDIDLSADALVIEVQ